MCFFVLPAEGDSNFGQKVFRVLLSKRNSLLTNFHNQSTVVRIVVVRAKKINNAMIAHFQALSGILMVSFDTTVDHSIASSCFSIISKFSHKLLYNL